MPSKKNLLQKARLYLILDRQVNDYAELSKVLNLAVRSGVDIVQLRDKFGSAKDILAFARYAQPLVGNKIPFIINDRVDLALIARCSGVHLGQNDISLKEARKILGPKAIIGISCQNLAHARQAEKDGADYIGFGSIFKTQTKPERQPMDFDLLEKVWTKIRIPVFPIGGITVKNFSRLRVCGVNRAAVCREICKSKDIKNKIREFKKAF